MACRSPSRTTSTSPACRRRPAAPWMRGPRGPQRSAGVTQRLRDGRRPGARQDQPARVVPGRDRPQPQLRALAQSVRPCARHRRLQRRQRGAAGLARHADGDRHRHGRLGAGAGRPVRAGGLPADGAALAARGLVPISPTFDTAGVMARSVDDCVLVDHAVAGGPLQLLATPLPGVRLGVPEAYFWDDIDPPVAELARAAPRAACARAGAVLVPCDLAEAGALFQQGCDVDLAARDPARAGRLLRVGTTAPSMRVRSPTRWSSPDVRPLFERPLRPRRPSPPRAYAHALHTLRPAHAGGVPTVASRGTTWPPSSSRPAR